ncbi:OmpA family protein [Phenylobacterium sp.]|uniref:OmpA family protein n=1 Tax=Phenylobacterium sp. TaxID=1871053 RepID=UPI0017FE1B1C|nr:OmpA family protein [Phenylobacterium sp.]MBA4793552.1 OmpA family protein [Phenylobacterium sp.]MBC7168173.1 OmpA family protein [Phenylobacterium sp.]
MASFATAGRLTPLVLALGLAGCQSWAEMRGRLVDEPGCEPVRAEIYFEPDSAAIGPEAQALIAEAARQAEGCRLQHVEVLGLADAAGAPQANLALSKARAEAVTAALAAERLAVSDVRLLAAGEAGAVTPQGELQPMRRRAEIVLRLADPD